MSLTAAVYARMAGDGELASLLATWKDLPAVFTQDPPPAGAVLPYIVTPGQLATIPFDTKDERGEELFRDIRIYDKATGSQKRVEDIAARVKDLFHRQPLVVDGRAVLMVEVTGPRLGPQEDEAYARIVTLHVKTNPA